MKAKNNLISRFEVDLLRLKAKRGRIPALPHCRRRFDVPYARGSTMSDWKTLLDQAMIQEDGDTVGAHITYGNAVKAALANAQGLLHDVEAAQIMEVIYGALVAYSQQVMLRLKIEDEQVGGPDHAFRVGQAYGVSCVLNHLIDQLTDVASITNLQAFDAFSDTLHNDILVQVKAAGLFVPVLDAKGEIINE
jgi:hypothetical protein